VFIRVLYIGVAKDEMRACKWYITAAAQGYAEAQNNLAICYEHGFGLCCFIMSFSLNFVSFVLGKVLAFQLIRDWQSNGTPKHLFRSWMRRNVYTAI